MAYKKTILDIADDLIKGQLKSLFNNKSVDEIIDILIDKQIISINSIRDLVVYSKVIDLYNEINNLESAKLKIALEMNLSYYVISKIYSEFNKKFK